MIVAGIDLGNPGACAVLAPGGQLGRILDVAVWRRLTLHSLRELVAQAIHQHGDELVATE